MYSAIVLHKGSTDYRPHFFAPQNICCCLCESVQLCSTVCHTGRTGRVLATGGASKNEKILQVCIQSHVISIPANSEMPQTVASILTFSAVGFN